MKMKTEDRRVQVLFQSRFYQIPRFQRPYSWTREQLEEFWDDTIVAGNDDYFIGAIVVYEDKSRNDCFDVVDGQQRLTTITILLAAIRDAFAENKLEQAAKGVQAILERPDISDSQERFTLYSQTPYPFFQSVIQTYPATQATTELGDEEQNLKFAFDFFKRQVHAVVESVVSDVSLSPPKKAKLVEEKLTAIRKRILSLMVIEVTLTNEDDAYLIFETLNTRGLDLGVSDLVKNHLTKKIRPKNKGLDPARDKYLEILERFDESAARINVNTFLHHSWLSRGDYVGQKELFKEIKKKASTGKEAENYLKAIVDDSVIYRALMEPTAHKWKKEEQALADSIGALQLFSVAQSRPLALALLRAYFAKTIRLKFAKQAFRTLESYHLVFTAITGQRAGGGFAKMYAADAKAITAASSASVIADVWKEVHQKLKSKLPPLDEFVASFEQLRYLDDATKDRKIVRYLLSRFATNSAGSTLSPVDLWTVEHLIPQAAIKTSGFPSEATVGQLGNLILVPEKLNEKLETKQFPEKVKIMKAFRGFDAPSDITALSKFGKAEVEGRTVALAKLAYGAVWAL